MGGVTRTGATEAASTAAARQERLQLRGRGLRFVLVDELARHGILSVAEMVAIVRRRGFDLGGRESKVISDALRWELARGRVVKLARGVYRYGKVPPSTARRIRIFAAAALRWIEIVATTRTEPSIDTLSGAAGWSTADRWNLDRPPWRGFSWLWNT